MYLNGLLFVFVLLFPLKNYNLHLYCLVCTFKYDLILVDGLVGGKKPLTGAVVGRRVLQKL